MNIFAATRAIAKLTAQFTAAGLKIEDFLNASDDSALQAYLETLKSAPDAALVETLTKERDAALAANLVFTSGLKASGIDAKAADEKLGLQAPDVSAAVEARASVKAAEILATKTGTPPVETTPKASSTPAKPALSGIAKARAGISAQLKASGIAESELN